MTEQVIDHVPAAIRARMNARAAAYAEPTQEPQPVQVDELTTDDEPAVAAEGDAHTQLLENLATQVANLERQLTQREVPPTPVSPPTDFTPLAAPAAPEVSKAQLDLYEDARDFIRSVVATELAPLVAQINSQLSKLQEAAADGKTAKNIATKSQRQFFDERVRIAVPDYEVLVAQKAFASFVNTRNVSAGMTNGQLLQDALNKHEVDRVAAIFTEFRNAAKAASEKPKANQAQFLAAPQGAASVSVPPAARTPHGNPAARPVIEPYSKYANALRRMQQGALTPEAYKALAMERDTASREGRIDYSK